MGLSVATPVNVFSPGYFAASAAGISGLAHTLKYRDVPSGKGNSIVCASEASVEKVKRAVRSMSSSKVYDKEDEAVRNVFLLATRCHTLPAQETVKLKQQAHKNDIIQNCFIGLLRSRISGL